MAQDNSNSTMEMGTSDQVLVASKRSQKLKYAIGFLVMLVAIAVVVTLVAVLPGNDAGIAEPIVSTTEGPTTPVSTTTTPVTTTTESATTWTPVPPVTVPPLEPLDLEEIIEGAFAPPSFNGTWTSENEVLFRSSNGDLVLYDVDTDTTTPLISNSSQILQQSSRVAELSSDGNHVMLAYNVAPIYRHSFLARYGAVDIMSGNMTDIVPPGLESDEAFLQNLVWGPSGTALAFVYLNNIFYQASLTSQPQQITTSGQLNVVYNGIPDWVYEEEVFSSNNAMWFSPDGSKLAYITFNDENVRVMRIPYYGVPGSLAYQYTQQREIRYPKPGTTNPTVTVSLRDLVSGNTIVFNAPSDLDQPILKTATFVNNTTIGIMWTNRVQTTLRVLLCSDNQTCNQIYSYTENDGWIDNIPLIFNEEGTAFITILPQSVNGVSYKQIVQISQTSAGVWTSQNIVNTPHTVLQILKWSSNGTVWYKATSVNDSAEQHIYSINSTGEISCFTCSIRREDGGECLYNEGTINGAKITVNCAGPNVPQIFIYENNGTLLRVWDDSSALKAMTSNRDMPTTIRLSVPIGAGLQDADVQLQVPADYQNRSRLPLLVYVYGGPDTALVTKQWSIDWGTSLASRWGIAVAQIDARGSGLRGVANMFAVNRQLGTFEVQDQINVTRYLQDNLSYIDPNRTCIWGWSYGGYASTKALAEGGSVFRCAAAVAPVVDWKYYDTIYTERYMDVPENNTEGYAVTSLLTDQVVEAFRNKSYFMIHGTADDNVHYQHAMLLSRLLQIRDVYFTQMSYTDEDHSLIGVRPHLYHALEKFLQEHML